MRVELRLLDQSHLEFVRGLRNAHRESFFSTKRITAHEQRVWHKQYSQTLGYFLFVIHYQDRPVGTICAKRLSYSPDVYEVGNLMLISDCQGKGFMAEALCWLMTSIPKTFWVAHTKPDNSASLRFFKRAGFWRVPKRRK